MEKGNKPRENSEARPLELRREPDGLRYYLNGEGIHAGTMMVMILPDGSSQRVRYEWSCEEGTLPLLFTPDGKGVALPEGARFR